MSCKLTYTSKWSKCLNHAGHFPQEALQLSGPAIPRRGIYPST